MARMKLSPAVKLGAIGLVGAGAWFFLRHKIAHVVLGTPPFPTATYDQAKAKEIPVDESSEPKDLAVGETIYVTALDGDRIYFVPAHVISTDAGGNTAEVITATAEGDDPAPGLQFTVTRTLGYLDQDASKWLAAHGYGG